MVGQVGWAGYDKACGWMEGNGIQYGAALGWPVNISKLLCLWLLVVFVMLDRWVDGLGVLTISEMFWGEWRSNCAFV